MGKHADPAVFARSRCHARSQTQAQHDLNLKSAAGCQVSSKRRTSWNTRTTSTNTRARCPNVHQMSDWQCSPPSGIEIVHGNLHTAYCKVDATRSSISRVLLPEFFMSLATDCQTGPCNGSTATHFAVTASCCSYAQMSARN